jgi:hypothetical protein
MTTTSSNTAPALRGGASLVRGWTTIAESPAVLLREYAFGGGRANALAVGLPGGKLMLVSPPCGVSAEELRDLSAVGEVVALVANNGSHHLGLGPARQAFPNAVSYAAPRAATRIRNKGKDAGQLEPIEKLQPLLGDKVGVVAIAGDKIGDVIVRVATEKGTAFYASDFLANIPTLPPNFFFKMLMKWTDSAPGFKVFGLFFKFFVADRKAACQHLIREIEQSSPTILVPAHGDVITRGDLAEAMVSMLRAVG